MHLTNKIMLDRLRGSVRDSFHRAHKPLVRSIKIQMCVPDRRMDIRCGGFVQRDVQMIGWELETDQTL